MNWLTDLFREQDDKPKGDYMRYSLTPQADMTAFELYKIMVCGGFSHGMFCNFLLVKSELNSNPDWNMIKRHYTLSPPEPFHG